MISTSAYDRGFLDAVQTRSRVAREALCGIHRAHVAERAAKLLRRALLVSGIVSAVFAVTTWWLLAWWLASR